MGGKKSIFISRCFKPEETVLIRSVFKMLKLRMEMITGMMDGMRVGFPPVWLGMKRTLQQMSTMQKDENLVVVSVF